MLIRTLTTNKKVDAKIGKRICVTDDENFAGRSNDLFVIDSPGFAGKLRIGDKITINYGSIELTVVGFEQKADYIRSKSLSDETEVAGSTWKYIKQSVMDGKYPDESWFTSLDPIEKNILELLK